jgi:uncharacterized delta-60 repeat protein
VPDPSINNGIQAIVRQPDGKYIVATNGVIGNRGIWRLNDDGSLDSSFQLPTFANNAFVLALALQADGKILVGGGFETINGATRRNFARLNSDGSLDSLVVSFGGGRPNAFVVFPDGSFIAGGIFSEVNGVTTIRHIARLNADGSLDQQFSTNHGGTFGQVRSVTAIGGNIYVGSNLSITGVNDSRFPVVKMNPNGVVDLSFNAGRLVGDAYSVAPAPHGKLFVGGTFSTFGESGNRNSLVRLLSNGGLDYTFDAGPVVGNNGPTSEAIYNVVPLPNKKIFVSGAFNSIGSQTRWCAARVNVDQNVSRMTADFDGDVKMDLSVFRPGTSDWFWLKSWNNQLRSVRWGLSDDKLVPADYDSDGITDVAIFRPAEGRWYIRLSSNASFTAVDFGVSTDIPTPADYDGDGRADVAVFRPSDGQWWINRSLNGILSVQFGQNGDKPVVADYDGDGRADIAIFRPSVGEWWVLRSSDNQVFAAQFGSSADRPVQGDYTGDRKSDVAFFRPTTGEWFVLRSENFSYYSVPFGAGTDVLVPGDYDGDGRYDTSVFRPSDAKWYIQGSRDGTQIHQFGFGADRPIANAFIP